MFHVCERITFGKTDEGRNAGHVQTKPAYQRRLFALVGRFARILALAALEPFKDALRSASNVTALETC